MSTLGSAKGKQCTTTSPFGHLARYLIYHSTRHTLATVKTYLTEVTLGLSTLQHVISDICIFTYFSCLSFPFPSVCFDHSKLRVSLVYDVHNPLLIIIVVCAIGRSSIMFALTIPN